MDASGKPRMSRRLIQRLTAHQSRTQAAFGNTGRSHRVSDRNCDRQRIGNYRSSALGARGHAPLSNTDGVTENRDITGDVPFASRTFMGNPLDWSEPSSSARNVSSGAPSSRPASRNNITRPSQPSPRFQEPPSRGYNPFS